VLFLNKLLPVFVLPIGMIIVVLLLVAWKKWRWLAVVAAVALYLASIPAVGGRLLNRLESVHPRLRVDEAPAADAILVLGGTMGSPAPWGYLPNWSEAVERFEAGVALTQAGKAAMLLFTGAPRSGEESVESEGAAMRRHAIGRGVPAEKIHLLGKVGNTADEARELAQFAQARGLQRVLLVTSGWHMPRAMRQFGKTGVEIVAFPVDYRFEPQRALPYLDYLPGADGLKLTELALREAYGLAFYTLAGR
jgi:uncharacterized SAM-binding protein YcdF (DUF218 family)